MADAPASIHDCVRLLDAPEASGAFLLEFPGCAIEVRSNSGTLLAKLRDYFRDFPVRREGEADLVVTAIQASPARLPLDYTVKKPDPGKTKIKEEFVDLVDGRVVRKRLTDMVFCFGDGVHLAHGPCEQNDNQVVNFINNRFIQWHLDGGHLLCHAAAVKHEDRGLALAGFSGMGKSTLALELMGRGTTFVSNDRLMIRRGDDGALSMLGVAKLPRVNPGTIINNPHLHAVMSKDERRQVQALGEDELWNLEQKYDAFIDRCFGPGRFELDGPLSGLAVLNWRRYDEPLVIRRVDIDDRRDLLGAFAKDVGLFYLPGAGTAQTDHSGKRYVECMGDCPVFELTGGVHFLDAGDALMEFLQTGELSEARR